MTAVVAIPVESNLATESVNVWHWRIPETSSGTEVNTCINALDTFYTAVGSIFTAQTFTIGSRVVTVDLEPNRIIAGTVQTAASGTASIAPLSLAIVCSLLTSTVGGSFRGRKYLGPVGNSAVHTDGRTFTSSTVSTVQGALNTLIATSTGGVELGIWSRTREVFTPVETGVVRSLIGTQRRRYT